MPDELAVRITEGAEVRVHYHPPGQVRSFVEGVVCRTEVSTLRRRAFVVDVTAEVVLDREQPVKPGYRNYVLYDRWEEFPGRIEVLSEAKPMDQAQFTAEPEPKPLAEAEQNTERGAMAEPNAKPDGSAVEVEVQDGHRRGSRVASIFGRRQ